MRRALAFTLAGLVVVLVLTALAVAEALHPAAWEQELDAYLEHVRRTTGDEIARRALARARRPGRFDASLAAGTFGVQAYSHRDAPFPPQRLYCVTVERGPAGARPSRQVVFVALHRDLHYADWVVYEGEREPFSARFVAALDDLGCPLAPTP